MTSFRRSLRHLLSVSTAWRTSRCIFSRFDDLHVSAKYPFLLSGIRACLAISAPRADLRLASRRSALGAEIARQARMPDRRKGYFADTWRSSNLEKIQREVRQAVDTERRCRRDLRKLVKLVLRALDARRARVGPTS